MLLWYWCGEGRRHFDSCGQWVGQTCLHVYQDRRIWLVNAARVTYAAVCSGKSFIIFWEKMDILVCEGGCLHD